MDRHCGSKMRQLVSAAVFLAAVASASVLEQSIGNNIVDVNVRNDSTSGLHLVNEVYFSDSSAEGNAAAVANASACECSQDTLDCSSSELRVLDPHVHACAWPVRCMVLRHNRLRALPPLPASVEEVDVAWNSFAQLPRATQLSPNIKVLDVSWNRASTAGDELHTLYSLEELRVVGNRLATLRFLPSPCALRVLRAADNLLWGVDDALARCDQLQELDLSDNTLGEASPRALAHLAHLTELRLARCRLALLPPAAFHGLLNLRALDLSGNELQVLPMAAIQHLNELRSINFAGNRLRVLPPDATFSRFPLLEQVHLSHNVISVLSENTFANLSLLETLQLDWNRLHSLPPRIFTGLVNLQHLVLSQNPLPAASLAELDPLRNLKSLYLDNCEIRELPSGAFANHRRLQVLSASGNMMNSVEEDALLGLFQLRILQLSNNSLDDLSDNVMRDLLGLHHLDVSHNRLQVLPTVLFTHLRSLKVLDASGNRLRALPAPDECCAPPVTVMLRDNELRAPDAAALNAWLRGAGDNAEGVDGALVDLRGRHSRFGVAPLAAALDSLGALDDDGPDATLRVFLDAGDCTCGGVRRRRGATVLFCVDTPCGDYVPGIPRDWLDVVNRTARYLRVAKAVNVVVAAGDAAPREVTEPPTADISATSSANEE